MNPIESNQVINRVAVDTSSIVMPADEYDRYKNELYLNHNQELLKSENVLIYDEDKNTPQANQALKAISEGVAGPGSTHHIPILPKNSKVYREIEVPGQVLVVRGTIHAKWANSTEFTDMDAYIVTDNVAQRDLVRRLLNGEFSGSNLGPQITLYVPDQTLKDPAKPEKGFANKNLVVANTPIGRLNGYYLLDPASSETMDIIKRAQKNYGKS